MFSRNTDDTSATKRTEGISLAIAASAKRMLAQGRKRPSVVTIARMFRA